jgi:hypothetical protein
MGEAEGGGWMGLYITQFVWRDNSSPLTTMEYFRIYYNVNSTPVQHLQFMIHFVNILHNLNFFSIYINAERWANQSMEHFTVNINPFVNPDFVTTIESYIEHLALSGCYYLWIDVCYTLIQNQDDEDDGYYSDN